MDDSGAGAGGSGAPSAIANRAPVFVGRHISKTFPGQVALDDVGLDIRGGEIHALVGQNGSGKSTMVKLLAGYHQPDPGAATTLCGNEFRLGSAAAAREGGIRFVHQDLGLVESLSVTENFYLVDQRRRSASKLHRRSERAGVAAGLSRIGYQIDPSAVLGELAESERTAVALARALADFGQPTNLLVLDEVTASLPGAEVERLFDGLRRIAAGGVAILFISHHLDEVLGIADRVSVLRDGRKVTTADTSELSDEQLVELLLGRELLVENRRADRPTAGAASQLQARGLGGGAVEHLDLDVGHGEVVGIAGLTGSGREDVAGLLAGRLARDGVVTVSGEPIKAASPQSAIRRGMCLVPADRAAHALLVAASIRENLTVPDVSKFWRRGVLRTSAERSEVARWTAELDIRPAASEAALATLSGGNQQKVVMARWLRLEPSVFVLDEPTQGVDVGSKAEIHRLIDAVAETGASVVVCSTDSDELARLAHRVLVMHRGRVAWELVGDEITVDRIEELQLTSTRTESAAG